MFKQWGAQLVNMTTGNYFHHISLKKMRKMIIYIFFSLISIKVPEVVLAKEAGLSYGAIAMATDYDCWRSHGTKVCVTDVLAMFKSNVSKVTQLLLQTVVNIAKEDWTETINELSKTTVESVMLPHN